MGEKSILSVERNPLKDVSVDAIREKLKVMGTNLPRWAKASGYKYGTVYGVVMRYAGSAMEPDGLTSIQILHDLKNAIQEEANV